MVRIDADLGRDGSDTHRTAGGFAASNSRASKKVTVSDNSGGVAGPQNAFAIPLLKTEDNKVIF